MHAPLACDDLPQLTLMHPAFIVSLSLSMNTQGEHLHRLQTPRFFPSIIFALFQDVH